MGIPLSVTLLFLQLLGWTAPNMSNPVVRATVVDDRVLLPTYKSEGKLTLVRGGPNLILDQPLHRGGPPDQLKVAFGQKDALPPGIRRSIRLRIDRYNFYSMGFSPFAQRKDDKYDKHSNPQYLGYTPLQIIRYTNTPETNQSDEARAAVSSLVVKGDEPTQFAADQLDYLPVKEGKFEWYYSGMYHEEFGSARRRFYVLREVRLPALGDQKWRSDVSRWATPLANDWSEGFTVLGVKDDRFFVTSAGRLFMAPRAKPTGGTLKMLPTELPIRVLIHDTDTDKHYAFTAATYFEIAETIRPRPHTLPISPPLTAASPLRDGLKAIDVATRCARLVRGVPDPVAK